MNADPNTEPAGANRGAASVARPVYINAVGAFLPGRPVANDEIPAFLGPFDRRQARIGRRALRQNGIRGRHYALDRDGRPRHSNAEMAALAARAALARSELSPDDIGYLAAAASQGDLLAPGIASMVHGALDIGAAEVASFSSFCASGMMALKAARDAVACGGQVNGLVTASEFASRFLRHGYMRGSAPSTEAEFLRWMLSDGAGAVVLEDRPNARGLSLRVEFIDIVSYAHRYRPCMFGGAGPAADGGADRPWSNYPSLFDAVRAGAFQLRQDLHLLEAMVPLGLARYMELVEAGRFRPEDIDWALYHFSSDAFRRRLVEQAARAGVPVDPARFFTNLYDKGNTGSASLFIMLEELFNGGRLRPGQKILCMVPESGRFIVAYMLLTVVGEAETPASEAAAPARAPAPAMEPAPGSAARGGLVRRLSRVWANFESDLNAVPIIDKLNRGKLRLKDYRALLLDLRQQVVDGARWIARAASNLSGPALPLRDLFIEHARDEHRDYRMLEEDFVSVGGRREDIEAADKNIGSEALSAWMFHQAGRENPLELLGAMFVIEGLGQRLAGRWGRAIQRQLSLDDRQVSFLLYHADNDDAHLDRLWAALDGEHLTPALADAIVKTAKVTARLYRLQLEELGNR